MTVALRVPEGGPAGHLTVVNESGRELATLTLWASGMRTVASRSGAIVVCTYLGADGSARTHIATTARITVVEASPGGTSRVSERDAATELEPGQAYYKTAAD